MIKNFTLWIKNLTLWKKNLFLGTLWIKNLTFGIRNLMFRDKKLFFNLNREYNRKIKYCLSPRKLAHLLKILSDSSDYGA